MSITVFIITVIVIVFGIKYLQKEKIMITPGESRKYPKINSRFFSVVVGAIYIICIFQFFGVIAISVMIEQYNSPPILGYIGIPAIICGVIVLIGLHALIVVVKGLENKVDILHQEKK